MSGGYSMFGKPRNPESRDWLEVINNPEHLEKFTVADLRGALELDGYNEKDFGNVTMGWGRKEGEDLATAKTIAAFVTPDNELVTFHLGGNAYDIATEVVDCSAPSPSEQGLIQELMHGKLWANNISVSPRAQSFIDSYAKTAPNDADTKRKIENLLDENETDTE